MRPIAFIVILITAASTLLADDNENPKESIQFDGRSFLLTYEGSTPRETLKEYLPDGQDLQNWKELVSIRTYLDTRDAQGLARRMVERLKARNKKAPVSLVQNQQTGAYILAFLTWTDDQSILELNVFKIEAVEGKPMTAMQYAKRSYHSHDEFLKTLQVERRRLVSLINDKGIEEVETQPVTSVVQ